MAQGLEADAETGRPHEAEAAADPRTRRRVRAIAMVAYAVARRLAAARIPNDTVQVFSGCGSARWRGNIEAPGAST